MKVYAFDVDGTLEISAGPVSLKSMMDLRVEGHIVGICGNWGLFCSVVRGWQHLVSFLNAAPPMHLPDGTRMDKTYFMQQLKMYIPADDYILVGNILGVSGNSDDQGSAERAGWRFIKESDFAAGVR